MPPLPLDPVIARPSLPAVLIAGSHPGLPLSVRLSTRLWGALSGILMIGGIVYAFWGGWFWAPVGIVVGLLLENANRRSAAQAIASAAATDGWFRAEMIEKGVLLEVPRATSVEDEVRQRSSTAYWDGEKLVEVREAHPNKRPASE